MIADGGRKRDAAYQQVRYDMADDEHGVKKQLKE